MQINTTLFQMARRDIYGLPPRPGGQRGREMMGLSPYSRAYRRSTPLLFFHMYIQYIHPPVLVLYL
jgi:hypothetical protein